MAFAKLSSALLVCKNPTPAVAALRAVHERETVPVHQQHAGHDVHKLSQHLKALRLPTFRGEYDKLARECAAEGLDYYGYLLRLTERELVERKRRTTERRIKTARFPAMKELDGFDLTVLAPQARNVVHELARSEFVARKENIIAVGNSGTGKTHLAIALGLAACQKGVSVRLYNAATLVRELMAARSEQRLPQLHKRLAGYKLLIIDELGYVPLPRGGAELLFEVIGQRAERSSTFITTHLPTEEWNGIFGSGEMTGALLDRLTRRVHQLELSGRSYRLNAANDSPARLPVSAA